MLCKVEEVRREMESRLDSQRRHMVQKESHLKNEVEELKVTCHIQNRIISQGVWTYWQQFVLSSVIHVSFKISKQLYPPLLVTRWCILGHFCVLLGSVVPCDGWHTSPVGSRASQKTRAGRGRAGEERTAGAPQRPAANQGSAPSRTGTHRPESGRAADFAMGTAHRADETAAEGGHFVCLQSVTTVSSGHKCIGSTSLTSAGRGGAQGRHQEPDSGLHQEEEPGGDSHISGLYKWERWKLHIF